MAQAPSISDFAPRSYQSEIFDRARNGNIICAMDTGSGKTMIAVLLVKWMACQPENKDKKTIFMVPKVPLVLQQTGVLEKHTPLRVGGYYGQLNVDAWDRGAWVKEFNSHDILVMTPQILYDVLSHAYWTMDRISLLIFDEAHHCQKKHPYAKLMQDHYRACPLGDRPKILGLTASPVWTTKDPLAAIKKLEHEMSAQVIAVKANTEELAKHSPKPTEKVVLYQNSFPTYSTYPRPTLWEECQSFLKSVSDTDAHNRRIGTYKSVLDATGPYGADHWVMHELETALGGITSGYQAAFGGYNRHLAGGQIASPASSPPRRSSAKRPMVTPATSQEAYGILEKHRVRFSESAPDVDPSWLSPKVLKLIEVLQEAHDRNESFHGIIFTLKRSVASSLAWTLSRVTSMKGWAKCGFVMGHGGTNTRDAARAFNGMGVALQNETIAKFRKGELNLLTATNVAEEGLDFRACHIIIRYDPLQTLIGYIQSRGRARREDSEYVVLLPEGAGEDRARYEHFRDAEKGLAIRYRKEYKEAPTGLTLDDEDGLDDEHTYHEIYETTAGAKLTSYGAIPLLVYLCTLIPRDAFCPVWQPEWTLTSVGEGFYTCTVTLPSVLPLEAPQRTFVGPVRRGKKSAKSSATFLVLTKLIGFDIFDKYLLPGRLQRGDDALDADGHGIPVISDLTSVIIVDSFDAFGDIRKRTSSADEIWFHPIRVEGRLVAALLTATRLTPLEANFPLIGGESKKIEVMEGRICEWDDREDELDRIARWFCSTLGLAIGGAPLKPAETPYLVAPTTPSGALDWNLINGSLEDRRSNETLSNDRDFVQSRHLVELRNEAGRLFEFVRIREDLNLLSSPLPGSKESQFETYLQYWTDERRAGELDPNQNLVELRWLKRHQATSSTLSRISDIAPHLPAKDLVERAILRPIEFCRTLKTPFAIFELLRTLPSVTRHISDLHRVSKIQRDLTLPPLDTARLVEALTIPASGQNYSFQRLENLGDSVLKVCTAVHIYNKFPFRHEGQLDIVRSNSVNNSYLLGRARGKTLHSYLIHETSPPKWKPQPSIGVVNGQWMSIGNTISRKCMPDVMEALLGVSYLQGGIPVALQTATTLQLCCGGSEPWSARNYDRGTSEAGDRIALLIPLQERLGYQFRDFKLLMEALCHPTFRARDISSYQRLEFLGDAVVDIFVNQYLFLKYPEATPGQISWAKARSVCNPVLGMLSGRYLELDKYMLADSPILVNAIDDFKELTKDVPYSRLVVETWNYDPPKPMSDLFEAVIGALLVDSNYDIDLVFNILTTIMADVLSVVSPSMPRDPTTELMMFTQKSGCNRIRYERSASDKETLQAPMDCMAVLVHDINITSPMNGKTKSLSKYMASQKALEILKNEAHEHALSAICNCKQIREAEDREKKAQERPIAKLPRSDSNTSAASNTTMGATPQASPTSIRSQSSPSTPHRGGVAAAPPLATDSYSAFADAYAATSQSEADIQTEDVIVDSFFKDLTRGEGFDYTEDGFAARARVAVELFHSGEANTSTISTSKDSVDPFADPSDEKDDDDAAWTGEPW